VPKITNHNHIIC